MCYGLSEEVPCSFLDKSPTWQQQAFLWGSFRKQPIFHHKEQDGRLSPPLALVFFRGIQDNVLSFISGLCATCSCYSLISSSSAQPLLFLWALQVAISTFTYTVLQGRYLWPKPRQNLSPVSFRSPFLLL